MVNPRILDLWEQELKLGAKLEELALVKSELLRQLAGNSLSVTTVRTILQGREQQLFRDLNSKIAHRERLEAEEEED